jgi:bifunctional oligoribonuclease and PAP phosphatase NrnA
MQAIQHLYPLLSSPKKIVITCHQKPDGDAMGSSLALYHALLQLQHRVTVISPTNWASFLNWMPGVETVLDFEAKKQEAEAITLAADFVFCLDFNALYRTKNFATILEKTAAQKILIDHHEQPQTEAFAYGISNANKSSTCEMVYDFLVDAGLQHTINTNVAACLYTGVMTDTGSFRFPSTTASVHSMIAFLKNTGLDHSAIHNHIYDNFLENRLRFIGFVLSNRMEVFYEYNTALMYVYSSDLRKYDIKTGDTEGLVNYLLTIQGIRFAAIVVDRDEERKWSFRSKGNFDVNSFARNHFEGGGHFNAAGGRSDDSVDVSVKKFIAILPTYETALNNHT